MAIALFVLQRMNKKAKIKTEQLRREKEKIRQQLIEVGELGIDQFLSRLPDQYLNVFNSGVILNLKNLQAKAYKTLLKTILKPDQNTKAKGEK